jgi:hypothetical protein
MKDINNSKFTSKYKAKDIFEGIPYFFTNKLNSFSSIEQMHVYINIKSDEMRNIGLIMRIALSFFLSFCIDKE